MPSVHASTGKEKLSKVIHWVNLRARMQLPESKICFGNLISVVDVKVNMDDTNDESYGIVRRMKDALRNVNITKIQNTEEHFKFLENSWMEDGEYMEFSSLCNFSVYEIDFGWGKPLFFGIYPHCFDNAVMFSDTKDERGIDAWIALHKEDMAKFETDLVLLAHLSSARFSRM